MKKTCLTCRHAENIDEDFILDLRGSVVNVDGLRLLLAQYHNPGVVAFGDWVRAKIEAALLPDSIDDG